MRCGRVLGVRVSACYPFQDEEPFVLAETPHILFAGNQRAFGTKLVKGAARFVFCRAVCVFGKGALAAQ